MLGTMTNSIEHW